MPLPWHFRIALSTNTSTKSYQTGKWAVVFSYKSMIINALLRQLSSQFCVDVILSIACTSFCTASLRTMHIISTGFLSISHIKKPIYGWDVASHQIDCGICLFCETIDAISSIQYAMDANTNHPYAISLEIISFCWCYNNRFRIAACFFFLSKDIKSFYACVRKKTIVCISLSAVCVCASFCFYFSGCVDVQCRRAYLWNV